MSECDHEWKKRRRIPMIRDATELICTKCGAQAKRYWRTGKIRITSEGKEIRK